ncbi:MAG: adenine phosphoribosyltransferase [Thermoplasmata archaeon]
MNEIKDLIRDVPDFPMPGIVFKDITPVFKNPDVMKSMTREFAKRYAGKGIDAVAGIESRGFIIGTPLAMEMNVPFLPIRKEGKLPCATVKGSYKLEYGQATIEMHKDAITAGQKVLIIDDLLATGGTAAASIDLVEKLGGEVVSCGFVVELSFLKGRDKLPQGKVESLVTYY